MYNNYIKSVGNTNGGYLMNWKIKKFKELNIEELYKILALRNEVFIVEQECPYLDCDDKDFNSYHLFCEGNGEIVSYLRIIENGNSQISIGRVIVRKNYRKKGIAREMMLKAIEFVVNKFKDFNAKEIVNYMHQEKAYQETELFNIISYNYSSNIRLFDDYK